jgi:hypothetical protein
VISGYAPAAQLAARLDGRDPRSAAAQ